MEAFDRSLADLESRNEAMDITEWMIRLTMDFLIAGMFLEDAKSLDLSDSKSLGATLLYALHVLIEEVFPSRFLNPFRGYMIWEPKVRESARCARQVMEIAQGFIDRCSLVHVWLCMHTIGLFVYVENVCCVYEYGYSKLFQLGKRGV
jgi:hypothetical protein